MPYSIKFKGEGKEKKWKLIWDMNTRLAQNEGLLFTEDQLDGNPWRLWYNLQAEMKTNLLKYQRTRLRRELEE